MLASRISRHRVSLMAPDLDVVPNPPPGWEKYPGKAGFPVWDNILKLGVPQIGFYTQGDPGETVAVCGKNLQGAKFIIWSDGMFLRASDSRTSIRTSNNRAQITLPSEAYSSSLGITPLRKSVCLLWGYNSFGSGRPIRINGPEIFLVYPKRHFTNESRLIRVLGKNLYVENGEPFIIIQRNSELPIRLPATFKTNRELRCSLPLGYEAGSYKIWVHNGTGDIHGWSDYEEFTVEENPYDTSFEVNVDAQIGANATEKITAARDLIVSNSTGPTIGGTIKFGSGFYSLSGTLFLPGLSSWGGVPIKITGTGANTHISGQLATSESAYPWGIDFHSSGCSIENVKLDNIYLSFRNRDGLVKNCEISNTRFEGLCGVYPMATTLDQPLSPFTDTNFKFYNNSCIGANSCISVSSSSIVHISGNLLQGYYNSGIFTQSGTAIINSNNTQNNAINIGSCSNVLIENNIAQSYDVSGGRILTRMFSAGPPYLSNIVIQNNSGTWIGPFNTIASGRDTNTGEIILFHGDDCGTRHIITQSNNTDLKISGSYAQFMTTNRLIHTPSTLMTAKDVKMLNVGVLNGDGVGQFRKIKTVASGVNEITITFDEWQLRPNAGDMIMVRPIFSDVLVYNNYLDRAPTPNSITLDQNGLGVLFYSTANNCTVDNNIIKHVPLGVQIVSTNATESEVGWWRGTWCQGSNYITNNTILDCKNEWFNAPLSAFYIDNSNYTFSPSGQYYSIGNVFRGNYCSGATYGVIVGQGIGAVVSNGSYIQNSGNGIIHSIIENNTILASGTPSVGLGYQSGLLIGLGANWTLARNNTGPTNLNRYPGSSSTVVRPIYL